MWSGFFREKLMLMDTPCIAPESAVSGERRRAMQHSWAHLEGGGHLIYSGCLQVSVRLARAVERARVHMSRASRHIEASGPAGAMARAGKAVCVCMPVPSSA